MQALLAPPREHLDEATVRAAMTTPNIAPHQISVGLDLLDNTGAFLSNITELLVPPGSHVDRQNYADVHGTCSLNLCAELPWGRVLVRPRMTLRPLGVDVTCYLGVFQLDQPTRTLGETPTLWEVSGKDLLTWLQGEIGATWSAPEGALVVDEIQRVVEAAGIPTSMIRIDRTSTATVPAGGLQWGIDTQPTFLTVANALCQSISYRAVWADETGTIRTGPYIVPANRAPEWLFTTRRDPAGTIVDGDDCTVDSNYWARPNWWRFIATGTPTAPTEGDGFYTVTWPAGQQMLGGRVVRRTQSVDAADQASLVAAGDQAVAADKALTVTAEVQTRPMPLVGHFDVYSCDSLEVLDLAKVQARSWTLPLDGSPMSHTWEAIL